MQKLEHRAAQPVYAEDTDECVLLIEDRADDAARILYELSSVAAQRFRVEWVTELSSGIDHLHSGGVGCVVIDLTLAGCDGLETLDKVFQIASRVPILIL